MTSQQRRGPLDGVRIVDFTHVWAGPLASRILADLGADVIKIEAPRGRGPRVPPPGHQWIFPNGEPGQAHWNRQGTANKLNRNKRSLCVDLKTPEGRDHVLELIGVSDVVMENFSARAMRSLGLGWDTLRSVNERLVYVTMPGFGVDGPYSGFVAYGPSVEPMTGLTSFMGYQEGEPRMTSMALLDAIGGVSAAAAVVSALWRRETGGRGVLVEAGMYEAALAMLGERFIEFQVTGHPPVPLGNAHLDFSPHGIYPCTGEDEWVAIAARGEEEWHALSTIAGHEWHLDERFASIEQRRRHREALDTAIGTWTRGFDKHELTATLQAAGVPAGPVSTASEFLSDPHLEMRRFFVDLGHDDIEEKPYPGLPVTIDGRASRDLFWRGAPGLGEHNREILRELLGLDAEAVSRLETAGVLLSRPPE